MSAQAILSAVVSTLSIGAATGVTETSKKVVVDTYEGLKSLIKERFGSDSEVASALEKLEAKPGSEARRQLLGEELESTGAASDPDLISAAQTLLFLIGALPQGEEHIQIARGHGIAQADRGSTATITWSPRHRQDD